MCGLAGFVDRSGMLAGREQAALEAMAASLAHRGPDDSQVRFEGSVRTGLAFRRLSVIDPSPAGRQPMTSRDGRWMVMLNGEITNAAALRSDLRRCGIVLRGHADTEALLETVASKGLESTLDRLAGMFSVALLDLGQRRLHLVRDRIGIKPMHWTWIGPEGHGLFAFASEPRALLTLPNYPRAVDPAAMIRYASHDCITGEASVWRGVHRLPPGHRLQLDLDTGRCAVQCWWDALMIAAHAPANAAMNHSDAGSEVPQTLDRLKSLLQTVVSENLVSDVPLGIMLSGGIDSGTVLHMAKACGATAPEAFVARFNEPEFDEGAHAAATARSAAVPLREIHVGPQACADLVPRLAEIHDEPFADASQVPTRVISQAMRSHVVVALSGDGGDEVFGGYHRHVHAAAGWARARRVPRPLRLAMAAAARSLGTGSLDMLRGLADPLLPARLRGLPIGRRIHRWAGMLMAAHERDAYGTLTGRDGGPASPWWRRDSESALPDFLSRMQLADLTGYLPDDLLTKVDRASMSVGLEVRVPLLDHRIVEFAWSLPVGMRVREGRGKWILRRLMQGQLPESVLQAPKRGFAVPLARWLHGPLREWAMLETLEGRRARWPWIEQSCLDGMERELQSRRVTDAEWTWNRLMLLQWSRHWRPAA
jgi:asparagine synthase (glutamine-hydrolysing)